MNTERVTNKRLNRDGWFWAAKFNNIAEAESLISTLPLGTKQHYLSKTSPNPYWVLLKPHNIPHLKWWTNKVVNFYMKHYMKITPMLQFNIVFWCVTLPAVPVVLLLILLAGINPIYRKKFMNWVERSVMNFAMWRNDLRLVKYYYNKAHLFDLIRGWQ